MNNCTKELCPLQSDVVECSLEECPYKTEPLEERVICHCEKKENAEIIAKILDCDIDGKVADVVEVVRCKNCKHHADEEPGMVYCPHILGNWVINDFFCAYGERRDDE